MPATDYHQGYKVATYSYNDIVLEPAFAVGFRDVAEDRPWNKNYDHWKRLDQAFYECGRSFAVYLKSRDKVIKGHAAIQFSDLLAEAYYSNVWV